MLYNIQRLYVTAQTLFMALSSHAINDISSKNLFRVGQKKCLKVCFFSALLLKGDSEFPMGLQHFHVQQRDLPWMALVCLKRTDSSSQLLTRELEAKHLSQVSLQSGLDLLF